MQIQKSAPRGQDQELHQKPCTSLPTSPQTFLPHITPTSCLRKALVKLVVTHIPLQGAVSCVPPTLLSIILPASLKRLFILQSPSPSSPHRSFKNTNLAQTSERNKNISNILSKPLYNQQLMNLLNCVCVIIICSLWKIMKNLRKNYENVNYNMESVFLKRPYYILCVYIY